MRRPTVSEVMSTEVVSVDPQTPFATIVEILARHGFRAVPVLAADGTLCGVVSEADLMATVARPDAAAAAPWWRPRHIRRGLIATKGDATTAGELMSTEVETVTPRTTIAAAARRMAEGRLSWMPVVDRLGVVGVLSRRDVLAGFLRDDQAIRAEVVDDVLADTLLVDPARVDVEVHDGVVTLGGELDTHADTQLAVQFTEQIAGVVAVENRLRHRLDERVADSPTMPLY
jgi:CBS domain-containing protein